MTAAPNYQDFSYTLEPGETVHLQRVANTVVCLEAPGTFKISFDGSPLSNFQQGLSYSSATAMKKITIRNDNEISQTVKLALAVGDVKDSRLNVLGGVSISDIPQIESKSPPSLFGNAVVALPNARTLMIGGYVLRAYVALSNLSNETIFLGSGDIGYLKGLPLAGGATANIPTQAAIYAWNETNVDVDVSIFGANW